MKKVTLALMVVALMGASSEMNAAANPNMSMMDKARALKARASEAASNAANKVRSSSVGQAVGGAAHRASEAAGKAADRVRSSSVGQAAGNAADRAKTGASNLANRAKAAVASK